MQWWPLLYVYFYYWCVSIPQAVSTIAIDEENVSKNIFLAVSIPQAVSTIAIGLQINTELFLSFLEGFNTASGKYYCNLSRIWKLQSFVCCFNTASGKYYCNQYLILWGGNTLWVSIPQAVSTIAISIVESVSDEGYPYRFQYRKR